MTDEAQPVPAIQPYVYRNPRYNQHGTIDCEIDRSDIGLGWVPFTANPDDDWEIGRVTFAAIKAAETPDAPITAYVPPTPEEARAAMPDLNPKQFRLAIVRDLHQTLADVDQAIAGIPDATAREEAQIEWLYSPSFSRSFPLIEQIAAAFSLTDEQIDAAWVQAATYV